MTTLIHAIRKRIPGASIATDIIVGFPGETDEQFQTTYDLMAELKMDVAHLARYSTRPGTVADRRMADDVSDEDTVVGDAPEDVQQFDEAVEEEVLADEQELEVKSLLDDDVSDEACWDFGCRLDLCMATIAQIAIVRPQRKWDTKENIVMETSDATV